MPAMNISSKSCFSHRTTSVPVSRSETHRTLQSPILWVHYESLGPENPALQTYPGTPAVFVFDRMLIEQQQFSYKRVAFLYECLLELPVTIRQGDVVAEVLDFARRHAADGIVTSQAVDPRLRVFCNAFRDTLPVIILEPEPFVSLPSPVPLGRFNRYWRSVESLVWQNFEYI